MASSALPVVNIIVDNMRSDAFSYQSTWATYKADQWSNATVSAANATNSTVTMTFNGTSVAFIGTTPPSSQSQTFMVSIDNKTAVNTSFSDPNPSSYRQWYQSPTLSDGLHTITFSNLTSSSIDFAVVTPGLQTPIGGERILVDSGDSGFNFSKGWRKDRDKFNVGGTVPISGFTLGNSTQDTETVGSSFSYKFSGSAIAIYGLFDFSSPSLLVLSFSIDSQPLSQTYRVTSTSPQLVAEVGQQPNYMFYSYDFLTTGEHTLVVNTTECVNQTFRFDYLTYVPAFGKASDMPTYSGGGSSGDGSTPETGDSGNRRVVTTVGAALGTVVGSVLLGVLLFLFLRRRARRRSGNDAINLRGKSTSTFPNPSPNAHSDSPLLATSSTMDTNGLPSTPFPPTNPNTNSTLGHMALMQNTTAVQYGLNFPHVSPDGRPIPISGGPASTPTSPPQSSVTWDSQAIGGQTVNVDPPSYEEVTSAPPR